jgi:hypothetical protein
MYIALFYDDDDGRAAGVACGGDGDGESGACCGTGGCEAEGRVAGMAAGMAAGVAERGGMVEAEEIVEEGAEEVEDGAAAKGGGASDAAARGAPASALVTGAGVKGIEETTAGAVGVGVRGVADDDEDEEEEEEGIVVESEGGK